MEGLKMLYVFVDIKIDTAHFVDTVKYNFPAGSKLAFVSTIQFVAALQVTHASRTNFGTIIRDVKKPTVQSCYIQEGLFVRNLDSAVHRIVTFSTGTERHKNSDSRDIELAKDKK